MAASSGIAVCLVHRYPIRPRRKAALLTAMTVGYAAAGPLGSAPGTPRCAGPIADAGILTPLRHGQAETIAHTAGHRLDQERIDAVRRRPAVAQGRPRHSPGPDRQPPPHHSRRPELQHGAALGRRAQPGRRHGDAEAQVAITPPPQWVRVVGGFTEHQFAEKRLPTIEEINAVAPDTPVFLLHLYDRALLNRRGACAPSAIRRTRPRPRAGRSCATREASRPACCSPGPTPAILYATLGQGAEAALRLSGQLDPPFHARAQPSRRDGRHRRRRRVSELSGRLRRDPEARRRRRDDHPHRLQPLHPEAEGREGGLPATGPRTSKYQQGDDYFRQNGAGEMLVFSAADFEDFRQPRPDMPPEMERRAAKASSASWPRTAGRGGCTRPMTRRSAGALDVFERGRPATSRSKG